MSNEVYVVMVMDSSAWVPASAIQVFKSWPDAYAYAYELLKNGIGDDYTKDEVTETDDQYPMLLEYEEDGYRVAIDVATVY